MGIKKMNYLGSFATFAAYRTPERDDAAVEYPLFHSFLCFMAQKYFQFKRFQPFFFPSNFHFLIQIFTFFCHSSKFK